MRNLLSGENSMRGLNILLMFICLCGGKVQAQDTALQLNDLVVNASMNSLDVSFTIQNNDQQRQTAVVDVLVKDKKGNEFLRFSSQTVRINAGDSTMLNLGEKNLHPRLWSPEHPTLYDLEIMVRSAEKKVIRNVQRIGFKTFEVKEHLFYLNGKPYRSEEHTSELQSLMRISYAVFCLKKKNIQNKQNSIIG